MMEGRCDKREEVGEIETETKVTHADGMVVAEISEGYISSFFKSSLYIQISAMMIRNINGSLENIVHEGGDFPQYFHIPAKRNSFSKNIVFVSKMLENFLIFSKIHGKLACFFLTNAIKICYTNNRNHHMISFKNPYSKVTFSKFFSHT